MKHCKKFSKDIQLNIFIWVVEAKLLFLGIETVELKKKTKHKNPHTSKFNFLPYIHNIQSLMCSSNVAT